MGVKNIGLTPDPSRAAALAPFHGADLLEEVKRHFGRFIVTMDDDDLALLALWVMHTHVVKETFSTPRLWLDSPAPECGKTTCLEHLAALSSNAVLISTTPTAAVLTRFLDQEDVTPTLLIDEVDRTLDVKVDGAGDLIATLNSGYRQGGSRLVNVPVGGGRWKAQRMPTYAAVALAGNTPNLPDDTRSRCIRVLLMPDHAEKAEETDWQVLQQDADDLRDRITAWADRVREAVRTHRPALPAGVKNRFREKWAPLKRVAATAGADWPAVVDRLALADKHQHDLDKEDGMVRDRPAVVLLHHMLEDWPPRQTFVSTATLVADLELHHPEVWGDESPYGKALTAQRMGRMLATSFRINSGRESRTTPRGYFRTTIADTAHRVGIPVPPGTGATGATGGTGADQTSLLAPVEPDEPVAPVQEGIGANRCGSCNQLLTRPAPVSCPIPLDHALTNGHKPATPTREKAHP